MAKKNPAVVGLEDFKKNLKSVNAGLGARTALALRLAGQLLQGESQRLVPVDFGILKASAYTRSEGKSFNTVVGIGYTALYAMYVHEHPNGLNPGRFGRPRSEGNPARGNFWDPSGIGQSKFLEAPARDSVVRQKMLNIFKNLVQLDSKEGSKG